MLRTCLGEGQVITYPPAGLSPKWPSWEDGQVEQYPLRIPLEVAPGKAQGIARTPCCSLLPAASRVRSGACSSLRSRCDCVAAALAARSVAFTGAGRR